MESMMSFPVVEDYKILLDPRMPSMGNHTSPNNEDLVSSAEKIKEEIEKINKNLSKIEKIKKFFIIKEQFTIENNMMTPTLKLKRYKIVNKYKTELEKLF